MKFPATPLKNSIFPYVTLLGEMKIHDSFIRQQSQYITVLEDALKKNVAPKAMEILKPSCFDEAKNMFSKMISEASTADISDKELKELARMNMKKSIRIETLSAKFDEVQDRFIKKFNVTTLPLPLGTYDYTEESAFQETIGRELDEYDKMYLLLILELPGLNISNASDAIVDFIQKRFFKLDEAIIRRVLDEWVAFRRELDLAMEKFDFTLYLLDNKSDLIFKGDNEGLANVVRSDKEMLAKNHREEAVLELLQNWKNYKVKGALKKKAKFFKDWIQRKKESQYELRMNMWSDEADRKKFWRNANLGELDMFELLNEVENEDASEYGIPEGLQIVDENAFSSGRPVGLQIILRP